MAGPSLFRPSNITSGLVGYWKLDEASGNRADSSGNGYTLTDVNTVGNIAYNYWNSLENSANFIKANGEYLTRATPEAALKPTNYTFACWYKPTSLGQEVLCSNNANAGFYNVIFASYSAIYINGSVVVQTANDSSVTKTGKWFHLAFVFDDTNNRASIYYDGNLYATAVTASTISYDTTDFRIGAHGTNGGDPASGAMKDAAFWNRALTPLEIKSLAMGVDMSTQAYRPSSVTNGTSYLKAYWKMNENTNANRLDSTGNNHTLSPNVFVSQGPGYIEGIGADFELSSTEYFTATDHADWAFGSGDFSLSVWLKPETLPGSGVDYPIMGQYADANNYWMWSIRYDGTSYYNRFVHVSAGSALIDTPRAIRSGVLAAGTWSHFSLTRHEGAWGFWVDGESVTPGSNGATLSDIASTLFVGKISTSYFDGVMTDLAVWKGYCLTESEVKALASAFPIQQQGIVSHWKCDEARAAKTVTAGGNVTQVPYKFNKSAAFFNGTSDYVKVPDSSDWDFGTGDFTVETFVNFMTVPGSGKSTIFSINGNQFRLLYETNSLDMYINGNLDKSDSWTPVKNTWYHVAVVRSSGNLTLYVDGVALAASAAVADNINESTGIEIGSSTTTGGDYFNGWMKEMRVSNSARVISVPSSQYASDANTKLLMHFDTPATSPLGPAIELTYANSDAVQVPDHADWDFGTGDFTVELFVNFDAATGDQGIVGRDGNNASDWIDWYIQGTTLHFMLMGNDHNFTVPRVARQWHHYALSRSSGTCRFFVDGKQYGGDISDSTSVSCAGTPQFGHAYSTLYMTGYIREIRVSNTARYTAAFTPSQTGWTVDANTKLYIKGDEHNGSRAFIDYETTPKTVTAVGTTSRIWYTEDYRINIFKDDGNTGHKPYSQALAKVDFFSAVGTGAAVFDGSGDYLTMANHQDWEFRYGDFTIEGYVRWNGSMNGYVWGRIYSTSSNCNDWHGGPGYGYFDVYINNTQMGGLVQRATIANKWYHFAMVRKAQMALIFVDGYLWKINTTGALDVTSTTALFFGGNGVSGANFNGRLDGLRVSNTAKYLTHFTPPSAVFAADGEASLIVNCDGSGASFVDSSASGSGTPATLNDAIGANHLTTSGTPTTVVGKVQSAVDFESGSSQYASIAELSQSGLDFTDDYALSAWIKLESTGINGTILGKTNTNDGYIFRVSSGNVLVVVNANATPFSASTTLVAGRWYHALVIYDGASVILYLNGRPDGNTTMIAPTDSVGAFGMGARVWDSVHYFDGIIDDGMAIKRYLRQEEIKSIYNKGLANHNGTYEEPAATSVGKFIGVLWANIGKVASVVKASIGKICGVD